MHIKQCFQADLHLYFRLALLTKEALTYKFVKKRNINHVEQQPHRPRQISLHHRLHSIVILRMRRCR